MKEELQQITIAKACGWTSHDIPDEWSSGEPSGILQWRSPLGKYADLPDYLGDLNAANLMEMSLSDKSPGKDKDGDALPSDRARYRLILSLITMNEGGPISASAEKRAEAFLRTISKWEGAPL